MSVDELPGERLTRRRFQAESLAALAASTLCARRVAGQTDVAEATGALAEYAHASDPSTRCDVVAEGKHAGGRFKTCRLVSQTWRSVEWTHELSLFVPGTVAADASTMLLWIDGGKSSQHRDLGSTPTDALKTIAAAANAAGLPGAVVRQVPCQPMFDGLLEDDLIAHTFVQYARTGDATWPLLLPMVKAAVEAMSAAQKIAGDGWGLDVGGFVVTGASKRGWTTWLTAAVDERVRGAMPMVIDMLSLERHVALQRKSFGRMSEKLDPYSDRGVEKLLESPRGRELVEIVDPFSYRERIVQPKVIALGTNDPYWPLEALDLYLDDLSGPRWVSYAPNSGHGLPQLRIGGLVAALARHVAGDRSLPKLEWSFTDGGRGVSCTVRADEDPAEVLLWQAAADSRDFREARWTSTPVARGDDGWRVDIGRPDRGFSAALVECRFPRDPFPLLLTTGVRVQSSA